MEWEIVQLGEVCNLIPGFAFKSNDFGDYCTKAIKIGDIKPPFVDFESETGVDISSYNKQKISKYRVVYGDYVFAMTGATIGKVGRYINHTPSYINQRVLKFEAKDGIDKDFIYYIVSSPIFSRFVYNHIDSESAQPNISAGTISKYKFSIPTSKCDQNRVSSILSSLDAKIETNNRINAKLEEMAQALFKSWFIDFEPFQDQPFHETELGMIPEGWEVKMLGNLVGIRKGTINPALHPNTVFSHYSLPAYDSGRMPEKQLGSEIKSNKFVFGTDVVLLSKLNPYIKRVWYVDEQDENAICSTEFIPLTPCFSRDVAFTYCCVNDPNIYASLLGGASGATNSHQRLKPEDSLNIKIAVNDEVLSNFGSIVTPMLVQINKNIRQNRRLAELRDALLPKLMNGEIEV